MSEKDLDAIILETQKVFGQVHQKATAHGEAAEEAAIPISNGCL